MSQSGTNGPSAFRRVVVKISGEALAGAAGFGIDQPTLDAIAADIAGARKLGIDVAIVIGGGNIFRGVEVSARGVSRTTGDTMGMLATVMNGLALTAALARQGVSATTLSALAMPQVCDSYTIAKANAVIAAGGVPVLSAGTGNPFFTTDTSAVLRAAELGADAVLKATNVDGVYSADPKQDKNARRFDRLSHDEAVTGGYKVMDATAFALAREARLPIVVFSIAGKNAVADVLAGRGAATIVGG